ncbi:hypothetical protein Pmi06nite_63390 [Planotetraspora mira]|uniref:Uncharacterized protein n=1 Tax=Planotetraspora mira TaxID=58121 RepID=A0A8J3TVD0_9ACTN|nr:hypothetical protein Pmi06nite_63390 [Planotetraspora mira]
MAVAFERGADGAAGPLVSFVGERLHVAAGECVDEADRSGGGQVVRSPWQGQRGPDEPAGEVSHDLDMHTVAFVLAGVVGLLVGDAIDWDQGAVEDGVGQSRSSDGGSV